MAGELKSARFWLIAVGWFLLYCGSAVCRQLQLDSAELNDATRLSDQQHLQRVGAYLRLKIFEELANDTSLKHYDNQWHLAKLRAALKLFVDPAVRNHWLHKIVIDQIENYGIKNLQPILSLFYTNSTDSNSLNEVRIAYSRDSVAYHDHEIASYKTAGSFKLDAHIFKPAEWKTGDKRPAIVFLHGGSWYQGTPGWQFSICKSYAERGMVALAIEYRVYDRHGISPIESIMDVRSSIRWIRKNASQLGIDKERIVACGSSAGGHLALCAAMCDSLDEPLDDSHINSAPNALVLYYSCFDPTLDAWFVKQVESQREPRSCSPLHNVRAGLPPSLILHGTNDRNCPYYTATDFHAKMVAAGNHCEIHPIKGAGHVFVMDPKYRSEAGKAMRHFLTTLGYLTDATE